MKAVAPPRPDFQEAPADVVSEVALSAVKSGWQPEEGVAALVELTDNVMLGMIANATSEKTSQSSGNVDDVRQVCARK